MRLHLILTVLLAAGFTQGCTFEEECPSTLEAPELDPVPGIRNPHNGQCESYGRGGGGGYGGGECGDYGGGGDDVANDWAPLPEWGICDGFCETLGPDDCFAAEECRGILADMCLGGTQCEQQDPRFYECWAITPTGPLSAGSCSDFGAEECARHNECVAVHDITEDSNQLLEFGYCADEPSSGHTPGTCDGEVVCDALGPECPEGTRPGILDGCYTGYCIPDSECDGVDPGSCQDEIACIDETPLCPLGTVPGVRDGCYTGYCIPDSLCEEPSSCEEASEFECVTRAECDPVYEGINCTCDGDECVCEEWLYESCS